MPLLVNDIGVVKLCDKVFLERRKVFPTKFRLLCLSASVKPSVFSLCANSFILFNLSVPIFIFPHNNFYFYIIT